jgi:hypothetical protein
MGAMYATIPESDTGADVSRTPYGIGIPIQSRLAGDICEADSHPPNNIPNKTILELQFITALTSYFSFSPSSRHHFILIDNSLNSSTINQTNISCHRVMPFKKAITLFRESSCISLPRRKQGKPMWNYGELDLYYI